MASASGDDAPALHRIADTYCHTGEGPLWHPDEGALYWVDIPDGELYRYEAPVDSTDDPAADLTLGSDESVLSIDGAIGGFTIQESGALLLFCDGGAIRPWSRDGGLGEPIVEEIPAERDSRFNDVVADPRGRVLGGTMPSPNGEPGALYRLDVDGTLATALGKAALPNGLGFTPDRRHCYFTETQAGRIDRFRYDQATGALTDRETFLDTSDVSGHPDGLTVDAEGCVWSAFWDGGRIARYSPDGTELRRVEFPAKKVSSISFGGPNYDTAFVTTALGPGEGPAGTRDEEGDGAGAVFAVDLGVKGVPEFRSRILE